MKKTKGLLSLLFAVVLFGAVAVGILSLEAGAAPLDPDTTQVLVREADGNNDGSVTEDGVRVFKTVRGATAWADEQEWGANAKLRIEIDQDALSIGKTENCVFVTSDVNIILREDASPLPITITGHGDRRVNLTITNGSKDVGNLYFCNDYVLENMNITTATQTKLHATVKMELKNVTMTLGGSSYIASSALSPAHYYLTDEAVVEARRNEEGKLVSMLILSGDTTVTATYAYGTYPFSNENSIGLGGSLTVGGEKIYYTELDAHVILKDNAVLKGSVRGIRNSTYLGSAKLTLSDNARVTGAVQGTFNRNVISGTASVFEMKGGTVEGNIVSFPSTSYYVAEGGAMRFDLSGGKVLGKVNFAKTAKTAGDFSMNISGGIFCSPVSGDNVVLADGASVDLSEDGLLDVDRVGANVSIYHEEGFMSFDKVYVKAPKDSALNFEGSPAPIAVSDESGVEFRGGYLPVGASVVMKERIALKFYFDKATADLYQEKLGTPAFSFTLGGQDLGKGFADLTEEGESYVLTLPVGNAADFNLPLEYRFNGNLIASTSIRGLAEQGVKLYANTPDEDLFKALVDYGLAADGETELKYFLPQLLDLSVLPEATEPVKGTGKIEITEISLLMGDSVGIRFKTPSDLTGLSIKVNGGFLDTPYYSAKDRTIDLYVNAAHLNEILNIEIYDSDAVLCASFGYAVSNINAMIYEKESTNLKAAATLNLILAIEAKKTYAPYTPPTESASIDHPLDGKKFIFIGNSYTFYGRCVQEQKTATQSQEIRSNDKGLFYQIAKENGADIQVTNWTYGNHCLEDTFGGSCAADRGCNGHDHTADLVDRYFDYVMFQEHSLRNENFEESVESIMTLFRAANPNVKFLCLVPLRMYEVDSDGCRQVLRTLKTLEEKGVTIVDWGKVVYDVYTGATAVPGSRLTFDRHSFVISQSKSDGHHQNLLAGYLTAQMTWCAITGDDALGQEYRFTDEPTVHSAFDIDAYIAKYYTYGDVTTNFDQVLRSKSEIRGFQSLMDQYLAEKPYRNYL